MKVYVSFGYNHRHEIAGVIYDYNCLAAIEAVDFATGRAKAFELFGPKFCTTYTDKTVKLDRFPRGAIPVGEPTIKGE